MTQVDSIMNADDSARCARRSGVVTYRLEDEAVVYDLARDTVHYLNRTARRVWDRCDGTRTAAIIADDLLAEFLGADDRIAEDRSNIARGIHDTIDLLRRDGLLQRSPDS